MMQVLAMFAGLVALTLLGVIVIGLFPNTFARRWGTHLETRRYRLGRRRPPASPGPWVEVEFRHAPNFFKIPGFRKSRAITFDRVVLLKYSDLLRDERLIRHEIAHVDQYRVLGPAYIPTYLTVLCFTGYKAHPFEIEATKEEDWPLEKRT